MSAIDPSLLQPVALLDLATAAANNLRNSSAGVRQPKVAADLDLVQGQLDALVQRLRALAGVAAALAMTEEKP